VHARSTTAAATICVAGMYMGVRACAQTANRSYYRPYGGWWDRNKRPGSRAFYAPNPYDYTMWKRTV
jgi:hypothetical protein